MVNLIATAGLGGRAAGEQWSELFEELKEISICALSDIAEP